MRSPDMRLQRDQALACLVLALCTALAVFLSVFGESERRAVAEVRAAVALHEGLLRDSEGALKQNQGALAAAQASLSRIEMARQK